MVTVPNKYEYTLSMIEDGCIYLGEDLRGITFPLAPGLHMSQIPTVIGEIYQWTLEQEHNEPVGFLGPEEYEDILVPCSEDGSQETPDLTHGVSEEDSIIGTPEGV